MSQVNVVEHAETESFAARGKRLKTEEGAAADFAALFTSLNLIDGGDKFNPLASTLGSINLRQNERNQQEGDLQSFSSSSQEFAKDQKLDKPQREVQQDQPREVKDHAHSRHEPVKNDHTEALPVQNYSEMAEFLPDDEFSELDQDTLNLIKTLPKDLLMPAKDHGEIQIPREAIRTVVREIEPQHVTEAVKFASLKPEDQEAELNMLAREAQVTAIKVDDGNLKMTEQLRDNAQDLKNIDESLKFAGKLEDKKDLGSFNRDSSSGHEFKGSTGHDQSGQNQMAKAMEALRQAAFTVPNAPVMQNAASLAAAASGLKTSEMLSLNQSHQIKNDLSALGLTGAMGSDLKSGAANQPAKMQQMMQMSQDLRQNAEEIAKKVMQMAAKNLRSVNLELQPGNLGKLQLKIELGADGESMRIGVAASEGVTRMLVSSSLSQLRDALLDQGIDADAYLAQYQEDSEGEDTNHNDAQQQFAGSKNDHEDALETVATEDETLTSDLLNQSTDDESVSIFA